MIVFDKLQPLSPSTDNRYVGDMRKDHIVGNITISRESVLEQVLTQDTVGKIADPEATVCIINPGPSARTPETLAYLNGSVAKDGSRLVRVLANAGYAMLAKGLTTAEFFVTHHPENKVVEGIPGLGDHDLQYLVSSASPAGADPENPSVIEHLESKGRYPKIWHAHIEGVTDFEHSHRVAVGTGSGAPIAALALFAAMGYKKFEVFGMDGSAEYAVDLADTPTMNAYLKNLKSTEMAVSVGGKMFTVTRDFWPQTRELMDFLQNYPDAVNSLNFSGNTANAAIFNSWNGREFTCGPILVHDTASPGADTQPTPAP